jgi:CRP-like cAMP-binding protein
MDDPYGYLNGPIRDSNLFTKYVCSIYFIFATLATVGYGDVLAANTYERILTIFIMLTGTVTFGYIVANVSTLMGSLDHTKHVITERVSEVTEYLAEKNVSNVLAATIIRHFRHKFNQESAYDEVSIMGRLPRELSMEISLLQNNDVIKKICIFKHIPNKSILLYIFKLLIPSYYDADQFLIKEDEPPSMISFLISGRARVYRQQNKKKPVKKNSEKNLPALETGIGLLTDANNVSLGGDEGRTPIRDHVRINTRHRHDRDLLNREKFKFESEVAQNDADEYQASKAKLKYLSKQGKAYDEVADIGETVNAKVTFKPAVKEPVRRPLVALDDSDEEKDDEVEHGKSGRYSIGGSVKVASNNVRFSKETFEDMKRKGRNFVGEITDGDFIGYYALMKNKPHLNSVRATIPCSVYSLREQDIAVLTAEHPSVALLLQRALALSITLEADRVIAAHQRVQRGQVLTHSLTLLTHSLTYSLLLTYYLLIPQEKLMTR